MKKLSIALLGALLFSAFGLINSQDQSRRLFHELEVAQQRAKRLDVERDQLEIEQLRLASPGQINRQAGRDLKMLKITPPNTIYIDLGKRTVAQSEGGK